MVAAPLNLAPNGTPTGVKGTERTKRLKQGSKGQGDLKTVKDTTLTLHLNVLKKMSSTVKRIFHASRSIQIVDEESRAPSVFPTVWKFELTMHKTDTNKVKTRVPRFARLHQHRSQYYVAGKKNDCVIIKIENSVLRTQKISYIINSTVTWIARYGF